MICADWDDMLPNNSGSGGVYYYHDAANHRFITEYDSTPYFGATTTREKFQIIIYDTTMAAADGHNEIIVQYMTTSRWNSSTVGIEDPADTIAICCLYNDTLHRSCAPWTPGKVIKYTTDSPYQVAIAKKLNQAFSDPVASLRTYPNPFHRAMQVQFSVKQEGPVSLSVFNISGCLVRNLISTNLKSSNYVILWDGYDDKGKKVPNGIYFFRFQTGESTAIKKIVKTE
jgi:hypothetical protein